MHLHTRPLEVTPPLHAEVFAQRPHTADTLLDTGLTCSAVVAVGALAPALVAYELAGDFAAVGLGWGGDVVEDDGEKGDGVVGEVGIGIVCDWSVGGGVGVLCVSVARGAHGEAGGCVYWSEAADIRGLKRWHWLRRWLCGVAANVHAGRYGVEVDEGLAVDVSPVHGAWLSPETHSG